MRTPHRCPQPRLIAPASAGLVLILAGCGGGDSGSTSSEDLSGSITYWASNQGTSISDDEEILAESIARFTEETGVEVELEVIPWSDLQNRVLTAISSGDAPDVLNIGNTWAVSMQATGAFMPWEGAALTKIEGEDRFISSSWATGGAEGEAPISIPLYGYAYSLYYNTEIFKDNGIDGPPETWDEFLSIADQLTQDTDGDGSIDQWGFTLPGSSITTNSHAAFILGLQREGQLYDEGGEPDFTNEGVVAGVHAYIQLMGDEAVVSPSNAETVEGTESTAEVAEGTAAMAFDQAAGTTFHSRDFEDYEVAPMPMFDAHATGLQATQSMTAGINISVINSSDNKDAATAFVAHVTSKEEQAYLNDEFTALPVVTAAYEDEAFGTEEIKLKQKTLEDHAEPMPRHSSEAQMEATVGAAVRDLFAQAAQGDRVTEDDVRDALQNAQNQM